MPGRAWTVVEAAWREADNDLRRNGRAVPGYESARRENALVLLAQNPDIFRIDLPTQSFEKTALIRKWLKQRDADFEFVWGNIYEIYFFVDHEIAIEFKLRWYNE